MDAQQAFRWYLTRHFQQHPQLSRRELARQAGISHVHVLHLLRGDRDATLGTAESIAHALGVELSDMISGGRVSA